MAVRAYYNFSLSTSGGGTRWDGDRQPAIRKYRRFYRGVSLTVEFHDDILCAFTLYDG